MALSSGKSKLYLAAILLVVVAGGAFGGYKFWDYKENNPKFCVACHLMTPAYKAWSRSVHTGISCHKCHHLSLMDQNKLLVSFIFKNPTSVPPRHGETIVPWKLCVNCHYSTDEHYPNAPKINNSPMHQQHFFARQIQCTKCHGYIVHHFRPQPRFCVRCHPGREVHGTGMKGLACLNCHTDRTLDLKPDRLKCLYCHGSDQTRQQLLKNPTIDVTHYQPSSALVRMATKIKWSPDSPMQFYCYQCHKPHGSLLPDRAVCMQCHPDILRTGKHQMHIQMMNMKCTDCHTPHTRRVTPAIARKKCTKCHEYRDPLKFIS